MVLNTEKYQTSQGEVDVIKGKLILTSATSKEIDELRSLWFMDTSTWKTPTIVSHDTEEVLVKSENIGPSILRSIVKKQLKENDQVLVEVDKTERINIDVFDHATIHIAEDGK